ncbi:MAG: hypothetical protein A2096_07735 [Spirochaetes bacterium GWF1_41_5]|nr:MAG: hypothetical protein A2096_07735 [Spirochaetes bacterium GWF1_41_5]HBE02995.1 hypothetical protein [Spirochaetia bacterium]
MQIRFLGVRGSISAPDSRTRFKIGCNTSCIELLNNSGQRLILDMGTGLVKLNNYYRENPKETDIYFVLSHTHIDHIIGFPYFAPIFIPKYNIHIFAPDMPRYSVKEVFENLMSTPFFPVNLKELKASIHFHFLTEKKTVKINGFDIYPRAHIHPITCYGYRINADNRCFSYLTDIEHFDRFDERAVETAEGSDAMVHDSQYFPREFPQYRHYGHSTYEEAIKVKQLAQSRKLYLFHYDPLRTDDDQYNMLELAKEIDSNVELACEGDYIKIGG